MAGKAKRSLLDEARVLDVKDPRGAKGTLQAMLESLSPSAREQVQELLLTEPFVSHKVTAKVLNDTFGPARKITPDMVGRYRHAHQDGGE